MDLSEVYEKYAGRYLKIKGKISTVSTNSDWHALRINDVVECYFEGEKTNADEVGQVLEIKGWSLGIRGLGMLVLRDCKIVK